MNRKLLLVQLIACGLLLVLLLSEWGYAKYNHKRLQVALKQMPVSDYQSEPLPGLHTPKQNADRINAVVERPLFLEGRRPLLEDVPETAESADAGQLEDWLLIGTYNKNQQHYALFRKKNQDKAFLKLHSEQLISGWQLKEILPDRVVLQQGAQQKSVMLRKPREQMKPPVPLKKPVPPIKPAAPNVPHNNPFENLNNDG